MTEFQNSPLSEKPIQNYMSYHFAISPSRTEYKTLKLAEEQNLQVKKC